MTLAIEYLFALLNSTLNDSNFKNGPLPSEIVIRIDVVTWHDLFASNHQPR